jgi:hypothetical protein
MPRTTTAQALAKFASFFKSLPAGQVDDLMDSLSDNVTNRGSDQWAERGRPAADQARLAFGPTEAASGTGATDMTGQYSTPGPQTERTARSTELGALLDRIRGLVEVPGSRTVQPNDSYLGKADTAIKSASKALRLAAIAGIEGDAAARADQAAKAQESLAKAVAFIKASAEMEDTDDAEDADEDDDVEARCAKVKALHTRIQALAGDTGTTAGNPLGGQRGLSVEQFLNGVAGAGPVRKSGDTLQMPPDFAKSMSSVSLAQRIENALDDGSITADEAVIADTRLGALNLAKAGRLPMGEVIAQLTGSGTPAAVRAVFGVESVPGSARMVG